MKFGMNLLLWSGEMNDGLIPVIESLKTMGYDGIEVPLYNYDIDYRPWSRRLDDIGMERTAVTIRNADDNPISPDSKVRQLAIDNNRRAIDCVANVGSSILAGPFHSALGEFSGVGPTSDEWKWGVEVMRATAEHAATRNITLAIECLNRFENYFLTNHYDAAKLAREVDHPNCRIMYDTFHANIEEKNVRDTIVDNQDMIAHVHISENDRSTPGTGNIRWEETFAALKEINYSDWLTVESFGLSIPEIAAATKIWRRMYDSEEQLAHDALAFMKSSVGENTP